MKGRNGCGVDDGSAADFEHVRNRGSRHVYGPFHVGGPGPFQNLFRQFVEFSVRHEPGPARVVHQDIEAAKRCHGFFHKLARLGILRHVRLRDERANPQLSRRLGRLLRLLGASRVVDGDVRTFRSELQRHRPAHAGAPTGDQRNLPLEFHRSLPSMILNQNRRGPPPPDRDASVRS